MRLFGKEGVRLLPALESAREVRSGGERVQPVGYSKDQIGFAREAEPATCFDFYEF